MEQENWNTPTEFIKNEQPAEYLHETDMDNSRFAQQPYQKGYNPVELKKRKPIFLLIGILVIVVIAAVIIITVIVKASGDNKESYDDKLDLGRKYVSELNYGQAIAAYKEAIKIDPKNRKAYIALAELYAEIGDTDKVDEVFKQAESVIDDKDDLEIIAKKKRIKMSDIDTKPEETLTPTLIESKSDTEDKNPVNDDLKDEGTEQTSDKSNNDNKENNDSEKSEETKITPNPLEDENKDAEEEKKKVELAEKLAKYKEYDAGKRIIDLTASSTLAEENYNHEVKNIFDENRDLCWCEGKKESVGNGEYIEIKFDDKIYVSVINIFNGYSKDEKSYVNNGKMNTVRILYDGGQTDFILNSLTWKKVKNTDFTDVLRFETPVYTDYLRIEIKEAVSGAKYSDTCISRIGIIALGSKTDRKSDTGYLGNIKVKRDNNPIIDLSGLEQGSVVMFGSYEQDSVISNGKEPIEWLVLSNDGEKALLLSKYALDAVPYNAEVEDTTWENCSIRKWLNNDFYNTAFSDEEKLKIIMTKLTNPDNPEYGTKGGNNTKDKVFLLSLEEICNKKYGFLSDYDAYDTARQCSLTTYTYNKGAAVSWEYYTVDGAAVCCWWLRSPGFQENFVSVVCDGGYVSSDRVDSCYRGVRPAIIVSTTKNIKGEEEQKNEKSIDEINKEADAAFMKQLRKVCEKYMEEREDTSFKYQYRLKDIDGDGIHEAIFMEYTAGMYIYAYEDGKVKSLFQDFEWHMIGELIFYPKTKSLVYYYPWRRGEENYCYYQIKDGKYERKAKKSIDTLDDNVYFYGDDKSISENEFDSLIEKMTKGSKIVVSEDEFSTYYYN